MEQQPMPIMGSGVQVVGPVIALTLLGTYAATRGYLSSGSIAQHQAFLCIVGIIFIIFGVTLAAIAAFGSKLIRNIQEGKLITTGAYAWTRNPVYTGYLFVCTGILICASNAYLLFLPPMFWAYMSLVLKATEEKWCSERFGSDYVAYLQRTNRIIPWFPR